MWLCALVDGIDRLWLWLLLWWWVVVVMVVAMVMVTVMMMIMRMTRVAENTDLLFLTELDRECDSKPRPPHAFLADASPHVQGGQLRQWDLMQAVIRMPIVRRRW